MEQQGQEQNNKHREGINSRQKKIIIQVSLIIIVIVVICCGILFNHNSSSNGSSYRIIDDLTAAPLNLRWTHDGKTFTLTQRDGLWQCPELAEYAVNQRQAAALVTMVKVIAGRDKINSEQEDLATYGLSEPVLSLQVEAGDQGYRCELGGQDSIGDYYCRVDDVDGVYTVAASWAEAILSAPQSLLAPMVLNSVNPAAVNGFAIVQTGSRLAFTYYPHGLPDQVYSLAFTWFSGENGQLRAADTIKTEEFLAKLTDLTADYAVLAVDASTDLTAYGLAVPWAKIILTYQEAAQQAADGSAPGEPVITKTAGILVGAEAANGYYVMAEGGKAIGIADQQEIKSIVCAQRSDFTPDDVCLIELSALNKLSVNCGGKNYVFNRTEQINQNATVESDQVLQITYTEHGRNIAPDAFESFYGGLVSLRAAAYCEQGHSVGDAVASFTFTRNASRNFQNMTLRFLGYDEQYYVADFNNERNLLVDKAMVDQLINQVQAL